MGRDHALSGALVGSAVATFAMIAGEVDRNPMDWPVAAILIAVTAGAALWPDIDHHSATATRAFGPLSAGLAWMLDLLGEALFRATRTRYDKPRSDGHRTITHTIVFAALSGVAVIVITNAWPRWGTFGVLFVMLSLALRGLAGDWARKSGWLYLSGTAAVLSALAMVAVPGGVDPWLLGFAVALGSFTHCLGDSCTLAGCPWLWPIPIRGQRWYPIGTPECLRFRTGTEEHDGEDWLRVLMWLSLALLSLAHIPGAYPWLGGRIAAAWVAVVG
jgi:membrane-bound metal-dependent hydrolase YbcI (DUF457 family)